MVPEHAQYWFSSTPAIIYSSEADASYGFNFVSDNVASYLGYNPQDFIEDASFWRKHVHPEDLPQVLNQLSQLLQQQQVQKIYEYRFLHKDGKYRWIQDHLRLVKSPIFNKLEIIGCWQDITEYKEAESTLQQENKLLQGVAAASHQLLTHEDYPEAIATALTILGQASGVDRIYVCEHNVPVEPDDVIMRLRYQWLRLSEHNTCSKYSQEDSSSYQFKLSWFDTLAAGNCVKGSIDTFFFAEQEFLRKNKILTLLLVPLQIDGQLWGVLGFEHHHLQYQWRHSDIATLQIMAASISGALKRHQQEKRLLQRALLDPLTELPNRTLFMDRLGQAIQWTKRHPDFLFAVLFLDLDRFKVINDCLGYNIGDQLLIEIATQLTKDRCAGDTVARLGGDEFAILLSDITSLDDAVAAAEEIKTVLETPVSVGVHEIVTSVSIGITLSTSAAAEPEQFLRDAEIAMFQAKTQCRDRHKVFESTMPRRDRTRLQLEMDLRRALERQELQLCYQPIVSLATNKTLGFEALARWKHPERGIIEPQEFIALAEETGLILALDLWVLQQACNQLKLWQEQFSHWLLTTSPTSKPTLTLSINLSGKEFTQLDLAEQVQQILEQTHIDGKYLILEITESVLIRDDELTTTLLAKLRALNVQLYLDDFGAGYSSLSYLHRFPVNALKIDRSFVNRMLTSREQLEIIRTIITLAHNLGLDVIAEGVETAAQAVQLAKLRCEYGQGYYFSHPLSAQQASTLLIAQFSE